MDTDAYLRFALALVLVIGLIALIAWLVRRFGLAQRLAPGTATPRRFRRLSVVEVCVVDGRRRLVLVKRDGVEHLLLLSQTGSGLVVERGIGARPGAGGFGRALAEAEQDEDDEAAAERDEGEARPLAPGAGLPGKAP